VASERGLAAGGIAGRGSARIGSGGVRCSQDGSPGAWDIDQLLMQFRTGSAGWSRGTATWTGPHL